MKGNVRILDFPISRGFSAVAIDSFFSTNGDNVSLRRISTALGILALVSPSQSPILNGVSRDSHIVLSPARLARLISVSVYTESSIATVL